MKKTTTPLTLFQDPARSVERFRAFLEKKRPATRILDTLRRRRAA